MRLPVSFALTLSLIATDAKSQTAGPGDEVRDLTFPDFFHGDGRQKLSEFRGQPVLVVTFADVFGGLSAAGRAIKLDKRYAKEGLVVILTRVKAGGTFGDGSEGVDLGAWTMKRYPGTQVRVCDVLRPTWNWRGLGMPPYYVVIGADGILVTVGSMPKKPKGLVAGVEIAMKQVRRGWGPSDEAKTRALLYGKRDLAAACRKQTESMTAELEGVFGQRRQAIDWLLDRGQWLRAKSEVDELGKASAGNEKWQAAISELNERFASVEGQRELALDKKLQRLLKPFTKKGPGKGSDKALRRFAEKADGTKIGERAKRMAKRVSEAAAIR